MAPFTPGIIPYLDIRPDLQTLDQVLFNGRGFVSGGIRWATGPITHVGTVVRYNEPQDTVLLFESTTLNNKLTDMLTGSVRNGVQLVSLSAKLQGFEGDVYIRRVHFDRTPERLSTIFRFIDEVKGRPYESNWIRFLFSAIDFVDWFKDAADLQSLFCSEVMWAEYQRLGFVPGQIPADEITPWDSWMDGIYDKHLPSAGVSIDPPVRVIGPWSESDKAGDAALFTK